jgi:hypothetical protein
MVTTISRKADQLNFRWTLDAKGMDSGSGTCAMNTAARYAGWYRSESTGARSTPAST